MIVARKKPAQLTVADLEALEPDEPRELAALHHHVEQLAEESASYGRKTKPGRLDIERLNEALKDVEASVSWRITSPLRVPSAVSAAERGAQASPRATRA